MRKAEIPGLRRSNVGLEAGIISLSQVVLTLHQKGIVLTEL